jgi:hypothetical protein
METTLVKTHNWKKQDLTDHMSFHCRLKKRTPNSLFFWWTVAWIMYFTYSETDRPYGHWYQWCNFHNLNIESRTEHQFGYYWLFWHFSSSPSVKQWTCHVMCQHTFITSFEFNILLGGVKTGSESWKLPNLTIEMTGVFVTYVQIKKFLQYCTVSGSLFRNYFIAIGFVRIKYVCQNIRIEIKEIFTKTWE